MATTTQSCRIVGGNVSVSTNFTVQNAGGSPARPRFVQDYRDLGEVSMAELSINVDEKQRQTHRNPAGGASCYIPIIKDGTLKLEIDASTLENTAMVSGSDIADVATGAVVSEQIVVVKNAVTAVPLDLQYLPDTTTLITLTPIPSGTAYVLGTDYFIENGIIYIPPTSAIPSATGPAFAPNVSVSYTKRVQQTIQGFMRATQAYRIKFSGYSITGGSVDPHQLMVFNAQLKPAGFQMIGDDLQKLTAEFKLLPLPAMRNYQGYSQYFAGAFGAITV